MVKSRSHHNVAHLQPLKHVPTKYHLTTPYAFRNIARTRLFRSQSLRQGQRLNQFHTMMLHTYIPQPMSLLSINLAHLTVSEIQPRQTFPATHLPAHQDTMMQTLKVIITRAIINSDFCRSTLAC